MDKHPRTELTDLSPDLVGTFIEGGVDGEGATAEAPPFRAPAAPRPEPLPRHLIGLPAVGQTLHDFELLRVLGTGAFGRVYLARQVSLNRPVAVKISLNQGQEARTLAGLEHDHIVRVFSEVVDADRDLRLLCMQYVAGTTLERVLAALAGRPPGGRDGRAVLAVIDEQTTGAAALLDLAALRDRELLAGLDSIEAGCWMGARLAEALSHAHSLGVLHRDVKPANVLVNRYGRPLLADFNISAAPRGEGGGAEMFGGTLAYMAPEHLDAFNPDDLTPTEAVDARSDVYSLGVVLFEWFAGKLPFPGAPTGRAGEVLHHLAASRRAAAPPLPAELNAPPALARTLARCLAPCPDDRFASAAELAAALESCRELRRAEGDLPPARRLTRWLLARPLLVSGLLILLPHLLGTVVNVSYNGLRIVEALSPTQRAAFWPVVISYNALFYPLGLFLFFRQFVPVFRAWQRLARGAPATAAEVEAARHRALALPEWGMIAACLGWLPGGLVFPLGLDLLAGDVGWPVYGQFLFSFTVSGLIALTYSVIGVELVVLRLFYPGLWLDARQMRETARRELAGEEGRLALLQVLAVLIPLAGASLMLGVGPGSFTEESYQQFRLLVTALLAAGMVGLGVAILAARDLRQVMAALTGSGRRCQ